MGSSSSVHLFYGYCWDEPEEFIKCDDDWENVVAAKRGIKNPWDEHEPEEVPYTQQRAYTDRWIKENDAKLDEWRDTLWSIKAEFGVGVGHYGDYDYTSPYVHVVASEITFYGSKDITDLMPLEAKPEWDEMLDRWFKELRVKKPQKRARWWLVSSYG